MLRFLVMLFFVALLLLFLNKSLQNNADHLDIPVAPSEQQSFYRAEIKIDTISNNLLVVSTNEYTNDVLPSKAISLSEHLDPDLLEGINLGDTQIRHLGEYLDPEEVYNSDYSPVLISLGEYLDPDDVLSSAFDPEKSVNIGEYIDADAYYYGTSAAKPVVTKKLLDKPLDPNHNN